MYIQCSSVKNGAKQKKIQNSTHAGWIDQEEVPSTIANANYAGTAYGVSSCGGTSMVWINGPTSTNGISLNGYRIFAQACEITLNTMRLNLGTNTQGANTNIF